MYNSGINVVNETKSYISHPENQDKLDSEETKAFLVQTVLKGWLETNNQSSTDYSNDILSLLNEMKYEWMSNEISEKEYNKVVKEMFSDVPNLGDVSAYVDPNFKLNSDFDEYFSMFSGEQDDFLKSNATKGAQTPYEAAEMLSKTLQPLKDATIKALEDNVLTQEERKHLASISQKIVDKMLNKITEENSVTHTTSSMKEHISLHIQELKDKLKEPENPRKEEKVSQQSSNKKVDFTDILYYRRPGKNM